MNLQDTLSEYLEFVSANNAEGTHESYVLRLNRFVDFAAGRKPSPSLIRKYHVALLKEGLSKRTVGIYLRSVRTFYNWAIETGATSTNPVGKLKALTPTRVERPTFTDEEFHRILEQAATEQDEFWPYAVRCAWDTGLRLGDVAELTKDSVAWNTHALRVMPNKTKRFGKMVEIPITPELVAEMQKQSLISGASQFVAAKMAFLYSIDRHKTLSMQFIRIAEKAKVFGKSFHCLRHSFVTRNLARGVTAEVISTMTGQTLAQVMQYQHLSLADKRKALGLPNHEQQAPTHNSTGSLHVQQGG